jgi:predicted ATPase
MTSTQYLREVTLKRAQVPSFAHYPFSLEAVRALTRIELHPKVTYFIGENGSGKSTLLEAIAVNWGFNAEGGTKNFKFGTRQSHSPLHEYLQLVKGVRRPLTEPLKSKTSTESRARRPRSSPRTEVDPSTSNLTESHSWLS